MTKLSGAAAEARLDKAWERIFSRDPSLQQIIHVLARPTENPIWLSGFAPFETWTRNGCEANDEVWLTFAEIASSWPYISNARRAIAAGIPNVRIFVLKHSQWESAPSWLHYLAEVHLPAIAGLTGEALYRVWLEDCRNFGLPDRDYDVNLYGADGVMLAGYQDGDVNWRAFLADDCDPDVSRKEHDFITSMWDLASTYGELIKLPPELQLDPSLETKYSHVKRPSLRSLNDSYVAPELHPWPFSSRLLNQLLVFMPSAHIPPMRPLRLHVAISAATTLR